MFFCGNGFCLHIKTKSSPVQSMNRLAAFSPQMSAYTSPEFCNTEGLFYVIVSAQTKALCKSCVFCSGGQKQKTAIAGAVAVSPECLVLDEATAMLDPKARREVIGIARELNEKQGITIILITHFMDEVTHADKIFVMDHGIVAESGTPEELFREPELLEKYRMELPPVTRLAYSLRKKGLPVRLPVMEPEDLAEQMERIYRGEQIC